MRTIKFRAWDERNKVMHFDFQFIKSGNESNDWIIFTSDKHKLKTDDNVSHPFGDPFFQQQLQIMQFTGLLDKNGKDIYEGDIVECSNQMDLNGKVSKNKLPHTGTFKVFFHEGAFKFSKSNTKRRHHLTSYSIRYCGLTIIGNIYDNPELLTK